MSVGGEVIETLEIDDETTWVNTCDQPDHRPMKHPEDGCNGTAVRVLSKENRIEVGDALWWQGSRAYWTPRNRDDDRVDVVLKRVGYSHSADRNRENIVGEAMRSRGLAVVESGEGDE